LAKMTRLKLSPIFRNLFDFRGYKLCDAIEDARGITLFLHCTRKTGDCPGCGKRCSSIEDTYTRTIRDLNLGSKKCFIVFDERKIRCRCGYRGVENLDFVDKYSLQTIRFEEYVSTLCQKMNLTDAADVAGIDWKTAKRIDKKYLSRLVTGLDAVYPTKLGVDEIAYRRGHNYLTVVRDLDIGRVIWVGQTRRKEALDAFFMELGAPKSSQIQVFVMDTWDPYIASVHENTNAVIVFDLFHVARKITEAVDKVRRQEFANADMETRKKYKKKRFLILKRGKRLDEEKRETLNALMVDNERLYQAYLLKEQALDIFDERDEATALNRLNKWFENVKEAGISQFDAVVKTIKSYFYGIVNYFKYRLTNAASEAFNNKINIIKRRAYGFHDLDYFKLKILQACGRLS
jgi:transposase